MELQSQKEHLREHGWCVVPSVLSVAQADSVRDRLWHAAEASERRGVATRNIGLDPNEHNVRVFYLLELDAVFRDLIRHPVALDLVGSLLGPDFIISNFTANIALPGSQSMRVHSDQSIVVPEPWYHPWALNIIWCLTDVDEENGATRYLPGSHRFRWRSDVPDDAQQHMVPFSAKAGSIVAMEGRVWHTSGANVSKDRQRALLFGYYTAPFLRPQVNWNAALSPATIDTLPPDLHDRLGLGVRANVSLGTRLRENAVQALGPNLR